MNRLVRPRGSFVRALQISRVKLNVFVEGDVDTYFYGQICRKELGGIFLYKIIRSDQLPWAGRGKSHLLGLFESMRRRGQLVLDFKGQTSAAIFFVDKDIDNLRRTMKRSIHLVYTEFYEVENYIFRYGKLVTAISALALRDPSDVEQMINRPDEWTKRAANLWKDWLKLCLAGCLLDASGICNYSASSSINSRPAGSVDLSLCRTALNALEAVSSYPPADFRVKFDRLAKRVDDLYTTGRQDTVFKGKWYKTLLADEVRGSGIATGSALRALPDRLVGHLLQSLDFSEDWVHYHCEAVKRVIALTK